MNCTAIAAESSLTIKIGLSSWFAWSLHAATHDDWRKFFSGDAMSHVFDPPDVSFIDPSMRRRLSSYMRMGLAGLQQLVADVNYPVVFASQYGDSHKMLSLAEQISQEEWPSPLAFGLSVHNALVGVWSILKRNTAPCIAIAAGQQSVVQGLIETSIRVSQTGQPHVFVYVEDAVPSVYEHYVAPAYNAMFW